MPESTVINIRNLHAHYGESHVLHGVDLKVATGEFVALIGRNGSGRSTILKSIIGLMPKRQGSIEIRGQETITMPPFQIARLGLGYCPEERGIFSSLTVLENLMLPPKVGDSALSLEEIFALFPNLTERLHTMGTKLSGGEQQMLAMARILRTGASLLLLDEITEGLAPVIVQVLGRAVKALKEKGMTILLVEQNFAFTSELADRYYIIEHGKVVEMIKREELVDKKAQLANYLSV